MKKVPPTHHHGLRTDRNRHLNRFLEENVHRYKDALEGGERKRRKETLIGPFVRIISLYRLINVVVY